MREIRRILVCLPLPKVGDFLLATPMLAALRQAYPTAHISLLLRKPDPGEWMTRHPLIDDVVWCNPADHTRRKDLWKTARRLREHRFDAVIYLRDRAYFLWIFWLAGIPMRIGSSAKYCRFMLTHNLHHDRYHPDRHEVEYNLDLLRPLGITGASTRVVLPISPEDRAAAQQLLRAHGVIEGEPLIVVNPSSGGCSRAWHADRYIECARALACETEARILIVGRSEERAGDSDFARAIGPSCVDLTEQTSLPQLGAILQDSLLHLSVDTGTAHLAAAVSAPCVTLFPMIEHWNERVRWHPWQTEYRLVGPAQRCPCCVTRCRRQSTTCIDSISVEMVIAAAQELLNSSCRPTYRDAAEVQ